MEALNLNRIPVGSNPVVHVSQYDVGRVFRFNLFDGSNVYTLDGTETIECNIRKLDGNVVTVGVTNTSSDYIDVVTTEQMTAIHGQNYGEIVFRKGGNVIGSVNFILQVEQSPLEGGITSDSAIYNLQVQVANYVAIEVANQYDSNNVIFDPSPVQGHGNGYTVTSEGIGTALDTKQDNITTKTTSGSLIHITDGGDNIPMKSLESEIVAVESGSGEKSPTNPYTISGFDSAVVTRCGKNLVNVGYNEFYPLHFNEDKVISASCNLIVGSPQIAFYDKNQTFIDYWGMASQFSSVPNRMAISFTYPSNAYYINFRSSDESTNYQIELGSTNTAFEAYNGNTYTFAFGQTVYGGHFDNKGNLVVTHGYCEITGTENWAWGKSTIYAGGFYTPVGSVGAKANTPFMCSHARTATSISDYNNGTCFCDGSLNFRIMSAEDTVQDWKDYLANQYANGTPVTICYELATPITLSITSQNIPTLSGENNIFSNCGDLDIEYFSNTVDGLVTLINEFTVKNATELPISDSDPTDTKSHIDGEVTTLNTAINTKQNANVLNIVKHYDSGTSSDALTDLITTYGAVNMVFAFDIPLGYFTGCLTFANDNVGSGFIVLSTTGRFWVVSYVSGTITLTELT